MQYELDVQNNVCNFVVAQEHHNCVDGPIECYLTMSGVTNHVTSILFTTSKFIGFEVHEQEQYCVQTIGNMCIHGQCTPIPYVQWMCFHQCHVKKVDMYVDC